MQICQHMGVQEVINKFVDGWTRKRKELARFGKRWYAILFKQFDHPYKECIGYEVIDNGLIIRKQVLEAIITFFNCCW